MRYALRLARGRVISAAPWRRAPARACCGAAGWLRRPAQVVRSRQIALGSRDWQEDAGKAGTGCLSAFPPPQAQPSSDLVSAGNFLGWTVLRTARTASSTAARRRSGPGLRAAAPTAASIRAASRRVVTAVTDAPASGAWGRAKRHRADAKGHIPGGDAHVIAPHRIAYRGAEATFLLPPPVLWRPRLP